MREKKPLQEMVVRFSIASRLEHLAVIVLFVLLLLTGLPQKWPHLEVSRWLVDAGGGIFAVRFVHRFVGYLFAALAVAHFTRVITLVVTRRSPPSLLFTRQDFHDAIESLRYYLGGRQEPPPYPKFDYRQKFEYWGLAFGSTVMVVTGLVLCFPVPFSRLFPADLIPASKVAHSNEALLALLVIIVWHAYTAHLSPEVFPMDTSIFTGKISKERLEEEHRLELEELFSRRAVSRGAASRGAASRRVMPAWWDGWLLSALWRTSFDSLVAAVVVFSWTRHLDLPSGAARRQLLALTLSVPLVTGVVASPRLIDALGGGPWLDTYRVLTLPVYGPVRIHHVVAVLFVGTVLLSLAQEILPAMGGLGPAVSDSRLGAVRRLARALDGWEACDVRLVAGADVLVATSGRPGRPRLHLSVGVLDALRADELEAVVRHEHAHWQRGRWIVTHLLFAVRLLQLHNPLALWMFREYTLEAELACDVEAAGEGREELARALFVAYRSTARGELATRARLRKRVDVLRGEAPYSEAPLPATTVVAVGLTLLLVLPWIV